MSSKERLEENKSPVESEANKYQVGGDHYQKMGIQHWDFAASNHFDYFQGAITKYVSRWKNKNGVQDLEKALHFLQKYIEVVKAGHFSGKKEPNEIRSGLYHSKSDTYLGYMRCGVPFADNWWAEDVKMINCPKCLYSLVQAAAEEGVEVSNIRVKVTPFVAEVLDPPGEVEVDDPPRPHPSHQWLENTSTSRCKDCGAYKHLPSGYYPCEYEKEKDK